MTTHIVSVRDRLRAEQQHLASLGRTRCLIRAEGIDFTSNDYLGLSQHPEVIDAGQRAAETYGAGAPGSRLLGGHCPVHTSVEALAAEWCRTEGALLLTSGWHANAALLGAVVRRGDHVASDALNHASLIDACRLTGAQTHIFRHNDPSHLATLLEQLPTTGARFIVTESVYSMDGDLAPLEDYLRLAQTYHAYVIVDEAHAVGLFGPEGQGRVAELPPSDRVLGRTLTGGKSLGVSGSFIAADAPVIEAIINRSRSFIYTTAVAPAIAGALHRSIQLVRTSPNLRKQVFNRAHKLRQHLASHLPAGGEPLGAAPIVPIILGSEQRALAVAASVQEQGFGVQAVRPPTVPDGSSRIRVVCHASHSEAEVLGLAEAINRAIDGHPPSLASPPVPAPPRAYAVLGTDTDVGKTVVSSVLTQYFARKGPARYLKPVQTGSDSDSETVHTLAAVPVEERTPPVVHLPLPASVDQAADDAGTEVRIQPVLERVRQLVHRLPEATWVVETAGGLLVPFNGFEDQSDLIRQLGFPAVLVARSGLGTLNHTFLSLEAAAKRRINIRGVILVGPPHAANLRTFTRRRPDLHWINLPRLAPLSQHTLAQWLDEEGLTQLDQLFS